MGSAPGIYRAVVVNNHDPLNQGRVRLNVPQVLGNATSAWAQPASYYATPPALGSQVWCMFDGGDLRYPVFLSPTTPPYVNPTPFSMAPSHTVYNGPLPSLLFGTWVEFTNSQWPYATVTIPPSGWLQVGIGFKGGAQTSNSDGALLIGTRVYNNSGTLIQGAVEAWSPKTVVSFDQGGFGQFNSNYSGNTTVVIRMAALVKGSGVLTSSDLSNGDLWVTPLISNDYIGTVH